MYYWYFLSSFSLSSFACYIFDIFKPSWRVNAKSISEINNDYVKMLPNVCSNLLVAIPIINNTEIYLNNQEIKSSNFIYNFVIWLSLADIIFYSIHRAFHTKLLYFLHEKHHRFSYTYGMGSIYASVPDFVFANLFPVIAPLFLLQPPDYFVQFIIFFSTIYTVVISHGGFKIFNKTHLFHHIYRNKNYGLLLSDRLLGSFLKK